MIQIDVTVDGCLELAGQRAKLLSRLTDEYGLVSLPLRPKPQTMLTGLWRRLHEHGQSSVQRNSELQPRSYESIPT